MYTLNTRYKKVQVTFKQYKQNYFEFIDANGIVLNCPYGSVIFKRDEGTRGPSDLFIISFTVRNKYSGTIEIEQIYYHHKLMKEER